MKNDGLVDPAVVLPVLVLSRLHHRPHELLRSTGVEHEERLTEQRMLLPHRQRADVSGASRRETVKTKLLQ